MNKIKNCKWECFQESDGKCLRNDCWTGNCDCMKCENFFNCSTCKFDIYKDGCLRSDDI